MVTLLAGCALARPAAAQQPGIDVKSYGFLVSLPDTGDTISALAMVVFRRDERAGDTLPLDLVGLAVDSVVEETASARARRPFRYDGRTLRVALGERRREESVSVWYHGRASDGLIIRQNARGSRSVFADNWPDRARYWLPTVDHPSDKATVSFSVRAPAGWKVVANGVNRGVAPGENLWGWIEQKPIPAYTMVIGAGEFTVSNHRPVIHDRDTIPIQVWAYPEDSAFADSVPFRRATEIVGVMEKLVGPFPYEKLAHVESSTRYGGMENSSAIFYAEQPYVERRMGEGVVRHETAHQWFGDAVTEREWHHLWLSEGLASYFDLVVGAALDGDSVLASGMRRNAESYFTSSVVDRPMIDTAEHDLMKLLNANNYQKGSWVLHMLRGTVGDSAFFRGIREYYRTYRDSTALSLDFARVMERTAKRDLGWFFRQWLSQPGYPQLEIAFRYDSARGAVTLDVTQAQPPAWGLFTLPAVAFEFAAPDGTVRRSTVAVDAQRAERRSISLPFAPAAVRVDPDARLLLRAKVQRGAG